MSNSTNLRIAGPFCVTDAHGTRLCCPAGSSKRDNGTVRTAMRSRWIEALTLAGLARVDSQGVQWVTCVDMVERPRHLAGEVSRDRLGKGLADFGHVVADALGGVYCGGNAVPLWSERNAEDKDNAPVISPLWPVEAYASAWREVSARYMTKTKRARLV